MSDAEGEAGPLWRRWLALVCLSVVLAGLLELTGLPAALLLGPMVAGIVVSTTGRQLRVANFPFAAAQALIGCLIAASIDAGILGTVAGDWPLFLGVTAATILISALIGYGLARWRVLPGTVAVWGSAPGASSAMVIMAQAYGADARLVAVMTYTRVVAVSVVASVLSLFFAGRHPGNGAPASFLAPLDPAHLAAVVAVAAAGALAGRVARLPAGALLGPMILGSVLNIAGAFDPRPPQLLLGLAYALVGWRIGLAFTRETVAAAARMLPRILAAMLVLIGLCGGLGLLLARFAGVEPITAYLATSPGGMDSVAIIAAGSNVDQPFVMALQALRYLTVLIAGPALARFVANRHIAREKRRTNPAREDGVNPPPP